MVRFSDPGAALGRTLGVRRGEVWWAELPAPWKRRPVVLIARDEAYQVLTWIAVAPVTTRIRNISSEVVLNPDEDGVPRVCAANLDGIQSIRREWLTGYVARLSASRMREIDEAAAFALGLGSRV